MGKPLSDQIINHPAIHKTSNFKKKALIRFLAGWLSSDQPELFVVSFLRESEREREREGERGRERESS